MGAKRALIVDDSKSARLFLARALEKYDIDVDNAESAEAAIEYLSHNHPDVIFMDHLMPGMDGLQAVRAIKNDPRTATIPVMMYTSQEGELFLGQARALGAVGVLPKQIRPTDVSKVLNQLHLVSERRIVEQPSFTPVDAPAEAAAQESPAPVPSRPLTDSALREHFAELRRALVAAVDTQTDRISGDSRRCGFVLRPRAEGRCAERRPADGGVGALRRRPARWRATRGDRQAPLPARAAEGGGARGHQELCGTLLSPRQRRRRILAGAGGDALLEVRPGRQSPGRGAHERTAHAARARQPDRRHPHLHPRRAAGAGGSR